MLRTGVAAIASHYDTRHRGVVGLYQNLGTGTPEARENITDCEVGFDNE